jgi:acyl carrier protein
MNSIDKQVKLLMSEVFKVSPDSINSDTSPHSLEKWDSFNHLKMVLELEDFFCIKFDEDEISTLVNFDIIVATISSYVE